MKLFRWRYKDNYFIRLIKSFSLMCFLFVGIGGIAFSVTRGIDEGMPIGIGGGMLFSVGITLYAVVADLAYRLYYFVRYGTFSFNNYYSASINVISSIDSAVRHVKDTILEHCQFENENVNEIRTEFVGTIGLGVRSSRIVISLFNGNSPEQCSIEINSCPVAETTMFDAGRNVRNVCRLRKDLKSAFG